MITFAYNKSFRNSKVLSLWSILTLAGGIDLVILGLLANQTLAEKQHPKIIKSCGITEFWKWLFRYNENNCFRSQTLMDRIYVYSKSFTRKIGKTFLKKKEKCPHRRIIFLPKYGAKNKKWYQLRFSTIYKYWLKRIPISSKDSGLSAKQGWFSFH